MIKLSLCGYGSTNEYIPLTKEEVRKIKNGKAGELDEYEPLNEEEYMCWGASFAQSTLEITDEKEEQLNELELDDFEINEDSLENITLKKDETYININNYEKGVFQSYELDIDYKEFNANKVTLQASYLDELGTDDVIITGVYYDGEELEDLGDTSTTGKGRRVLVFKTDKEYGVVDKIIAES
jgi:hypothetical protein